MKLKSNTNTTRLLWRDSPCTLGCVLNNPPIDQAKRFHYGSIYFKDEVNKPKKVFTQFQKPQLLLLNFRRHIEEVSLHARKSSRKYSETGIHSRQKNNQFRSTKPIDHKLYEKPEKLEFRHDKYGNRSSYHGDYSVKEMSERLKNTKRNFYSSQRIDLSKPHNFYPGPGTYFNNEDKTLENMRNTFSHRARVSSLPNKNLEIKNH